jgi:L-ascorbate metabolism protein UlaG (beta-lactamase superfamily)
MRNRLRNQPYNTFSRLAAGLWATSLAFLLAFLCANTAVSQMVFQEDIIKTSGGDLEITCIGHSAVMFTFGGKVTYSDPISSVADLTKLPKADLILVTHEHGDHLDPKVIQALSTNQTVIVANEASLKSVPNAVAMKNGETKTVAGLKIEAVPAYNLEKSFHPKGHGNGYIITFGDTRVYLAGDTENTPEMKSLKQIDIAFWPMNLPYTMTPEMVADAAKAFRPKILYPYHLGDSDTGALVRLLQGEKGIEVRIRDMK